jgi:hypothetical protein
MRRHHCPKCNQPSFTFWQKQLLGPLKKVSCSSCGARVSVPWGISVLIIVVASTVVSVGPFVAAAAAWNQFGLVGAALAFVGCVVLVAGVGGWAYDRFVPLVTRDA